MGDASIAQSGAREQHRRIGERLKNLVSDLAEREKTLAALRRQLGNPPRGDWRMLCRHVRAVDEHKALREEVRQVRLELRLAHKQLVEADELIRSLRRDLIVAVRGGGTHAGGITTIESEPAPAALPVEAVPSALQGSRTTHVNDPPGSAPCNAEPTPPHVQLADAVHRASERDRARHAATPGACTASGERVPRARAQDGGGSGALPQSAPAHVAPEALARMHGGEPQLRARGVACGRFSNVAGAPLHDEVRVLSLERGVGRGKRPRGDYFTSAGVSEDIQTVREYEMFVKGVKLGLALVSHVCEHVKKHVRVEQELEENDDRTGDSAARSAGADVARPAA